MSSNVIVVLGGGVFVDVAVLVPVDVAVGVFVGPPGVSVGVAVRVLVGVAGGGPTGPSANFRLSKFTSQLAELKTVT
jgi:hypothetical protein